MYQKPKRSPTTDSVNNRIPASVRKKLRSRRGLSMTEMLLCVVILLLSTGLAVQMLTLGISQFHARTRDSEAEMLCNTLALAVRDQLACVSWVDGEKFAFENGRFDSDGLAFRSGANGLNTVKCEFTMQGGESRTNASLNDESRDDTRTLPALKYENADLAIPLVSKDDFAGKGTGAMALAVEKFEVVYDKTAGKFTVDIIIARGDGNTVENKFEIIPVILNP